MRPVVKEKAPQAVAERLLEYIAEARLPSGHRLPPERELCRALQVGRTSVREGLRILESIGVLHVRQGEGSFVSELSLGRVLEGALPAPQLVTLERREIAEILEVRRLLEVEAARKAARARTDAHLRKLFALLESMEAHLREPEAFLREDLAFHVTMAEASGNATLSLIVKLLRHLYSKHSATILRDAAITFRSFGDHRRIYEAIEGGKEGAAAGAMRAHLVWAEKIVLRLLDEGG